MHCFKNKNTVMRNSKIHCTPISGFYLICNLCFREVARILKHDTKLCSLCTERIAKLKLTRRLTRTLTGESLQSFIYQ